MRQRRNKIGFRLVGVVVLAVSTLAADATHSHAQAQFIVRTSGASGEATVNFPEDRTVMRRLKLAQGRIADEDYTQALEILGSVLSGPDFFFQPDGQQDSYISVKAEARRMIGRLPAAGRQAYELAFGVAARKRLREAIDSGDTQLLAQVANETFHTQAGYEAMLLLGDYHLDHGGWLAAAGCYRRLLAAPPEVQGKLEPSLSFRTAAALFQAGQQVAASETLQALKKSRPGATFTIAGRETGLFAAGAEPLEWLQTQVGGAHALAAKVAEQWALHRGDAARNAVSRAGGSFFNFAWKAPFYIAGAPAGKSPAAPDPLYTDRHVAESLANWEKEQSRADAAPPLASQPLRVGGLVVFRTATAIMAIEERTGKARWRAAIDDNLQNLIRQIDREPASAESPNNNPSGLPNADPFGATPSTNVTPTGANSLLDLSLQRRVWYDRVYGALSSDGRRVYAVEELNLYPNQSYVAKVVNGRRVMVRLGEEPKSENRLRAYDLNSGRLLWELARVSDGKEKATAANAFFLGPPLPLADRLYVLAEVAGSVRLVVVDPNPRPEPKVLWTQPLGDAEQNVTQDTLRSLAGASPSYADGVLICPTAAGAVVALDLASQSLLWGYKYRRNLHTASNRLGGGVFGIAGGGFGGRRVIIQGRPTNNMLAAQLPGWCDTSVTIADGLALLTPEGSDELHCVDLMTGAKVWGPTKVDNGLYVACALNGQAVVVAQRAVVAFDLRTGREDWRKVLPAGAHPTGRGFASLGKYHIPLSTGDIATVDIKHGDLQTRAAPTDGESEQAGLGSLVCAGDWVLSQTTSELIGYHLDSPKDLSAHLREHPNDVRNILRLGHIYRQQDRLAEAIAQFRRAVELSGEDEPRSLLFDTLLLALRRDFLEYRNHMDELTELAATADERGRLWRTLAQRAARARRARRGPRLLFETAGRWRRERTAGAFRQASGDRRQTLAAPAIATLVERRLAGRPPTDRSRRAQPRCGLDARPKRFSRCAPQRDRSLWRGVGWRRIAGGAIGPVVEDGRSAVDRSGAIAAPQDRIGG